MEAYRSSHGLQLREKGDDRRHPGDGLPIIVLVDAFWHAELDFLCCFVVQSMFGWRLVCFDGFWLIN